MSLMSNEINCHCCFLVQTFFCSQKRRSHDNKCDSSQQQNIWFIFTCKTDVFTELKKIKIHFILEKKNPNDLQPFNLQPFYLVKITNRWLFARISFHTHYKMLSLVKGCVMHGKSRNLTVYRTLAKISIGSKISMSRK